MSTLFDYSDYKKALKFLVRHFPGEKRGLQTRLSEHIGCQQAYLSRVFANRADLSQEQALATSDFFNLDQLETEYFLMLLNQNRSGTTKLKNFYALKIEALKARKLDIKSRVVTEGSLSQKASMTYYSDWSYSAAHMAIACSEYQTISKLSQRLGLPEARIMEVLEFLESEGLAEKKGSKYHHRVATIHLGSDESLNRIHHANWRLRSIDSLSKKAAESLNYSSTVSCGHDDTTKIREILLKAIQEIRAVVKESPSEDVFCYNLDFFKI
ncbi:MAG: TIGR02147 family protein [Proteobacteria bacterium]|nr:MAG: TIGR02147 family protein [Pseudomonadota bacterium]